MKKLLRTALITLCSFGAFALAAAPARALETPYLNGSYAGGGSVNLWWSQVPGATYQVFYGPKGNPWAHGAEAGSGTSFTVGSLFENTSYSFTVKSVRNGEVSGYSNWVSVWVGATGRPALPAQPVAMQQPVAAVGSVVNGQVVTPAVYYNQALDTMRSDAAPNSPYISSGKVGYGTHNLRTSRGFEPGSIILHWNEPMMSDVGDYNIVYTDDPTVEKWGVIDIPGNARNFTVRGLTPGVRYYFWMSSDGTGRTPWVSDLAR